MTARAYAAAVLPRLERVAHDQVPEIERAGALVAEALAGGHRIWVTQTSHYLHLEATHRAGGLMAVHVLEDEAAIEAGDVVLIGITAGAAGEIVEMALGFQAAGASVVALTQGEFERHSDLPATHVSGRRLADVADVHIDIGGPYGDGEFEIEAGGRRARILPSSGVTSLLALWMLFAEAVERLRERGIEPLVYESNLLPGARERNGERELEYRRTRRGVRTASGSDA